MCTTLGIDHDISQITGWLDTMALSGSFNLADDLPAVDDAVAALWACIENVVRVRRAGPARDDLLQALLEARTGDDHLSEDELVGSIVSLLFAGHDTTTNQLASLIVLLARHPDQWDRIATNPSLVPRAVEEALRYGPAVDTNYRIATADLTYRGLGIPAGTLIMLSVPAAGRDPAAHPSPATFRIDRNEPNLAFGAGPHYCLGASMARAEMQEALHAMLERRVRPELVGEVSYHPPIGLTGPARVPLRFRSTESDEH